MWGAQMRGAHVVSSLPKGVSSVVPRTGSHAACTVGRIHGQLENISKQADVNPNILRALQVGRRNIGWVIDW